VPGEPQLSLRTGEHAPPVGDHRSATFIAERVGITSATVAEWQTSNKTLTEQDAKSAGLIHDVCRPEIPANAFVRQVLPNYPN
jgi:hypothetical protein